jgi:nitrogen fixation protein NifU and related proteins
VVYSSVIRERFRAPRYRGTLPEADAAFEDVNPLCGDRIRIECRIADSTLTDARHRGDSCAICAASADVLLESVIGLPVEAALKTTAADLLTRLQADVRASRLKCVTLPLTVLQGALEGREVAR